MWVECRRNFNTSTICCWRAPRGEWGRKRAPAATGRGGAFAAARLSRCTHRKQGCCRWAQSAAPSAASRGSLLRRRFLPRRHGDARCLRSRWDGSFGLSLLSSHVVQVEDCRWGWREEWNIRGKGLSPVRRSTQSSMLSSAEPSKDVLRQVRRRFIAVSHWAGGKAVKKTVSPLAILVGAEVDCQQRNASAGERLHSTHPAHSDARTHLHKDMPWFKSQKWQLKIILNAFTELSVSVIAAGSGAKNRAVARDRNFIPKQAPSSPLRALNASHACTGKLWQVSPGKG